MPTIMPTIKNPHSLEIKNITQALKTDIQNGLADIQVAENRGLYGSNTLMASKKKSSIILLLEQFNNPIIYILIIAGIINAIVADLNDVLVIAFVVILNTVIGFFQESSASKALDALKKMSAPFARVLRNSEQISIPASELVVGDIIILESGVRCPADARLIDTNNLLVDESMLTGESFAVDKKANMVYDAKTALGDRQNMAFSGTIIQKGRATAIVTAVGTETEFGKISKNVVEAVEVASPLQTQMEKFSKWLSIAIVSTVAAIFIIGLIRGNDWALMMLTSVGLAVSAIPEGLPVAVTITLSIGISQMAKHKAIVKKLAAVETLGSTNVICTDKTGTLTKNQMTVAKMWIAGADFEVTGSGYEKAGKVIDCRNKSEILYSANKAIDLAVLNCALCTESSISDNGKEWAVSGDPTEAALMIAADKMQFANDGKEKYSVNVDIPFESENQIMAVRAENSMHNFAFAKGAPEKIIARCSDMLDINGNKIELNKDSLDTKVAELSKSGLRVLALAYSKISQDTILNFNNLKELTFIGFAAIEDSVRAEAVEAVSECHNAGIKVVMITGDHVQTAKAVAKSVGIGYEKDYPEGITGQELEEMSDDELFNKVNDIDVYARVAPEHKLRIVRQIQKHGKIAAMTGDGVNDAPALKQADIGVAMGSGSDVAKESASMILMNDNFATIVQAVRRGRVVLHNLQHILLYILATSLGGLLTIAASVLIGFPLPVLPAQLLWINLVTDGTSTFPLAFENEHGNVMAFAPRKKGTPLINKQMAYRIIFAGLLMTVGTLAVFYYYAKDIIFIPMPATAEGLKNYHSILSYAQTMAFCILAFFQIWNTQNSRSIDRSLFFNLSFSKGKKLDRIKFKDNTTLLSVMLLVVLLQIISVEVPFMNTLLKTTPLNLHDWLIVSSVSLSIIVLVEIIKFISVKRGKHMQNIQLNKAYK